MHKLVRAIILLAVAAMPACSLLDEPQAPNGGGVITLRFDGNEPSATAPNADVLTALARAMPTADSLKVCVFRPTGSELEKCDSSSLSGAGGVIEVELSVIAEDNKRVTVELFEAGKIVFFGVNEDVDVVANQNTDVSITATTFSIASLSRIPAAPAQVADGEALTIVWSTSPGATQYRYQESDKSDFSNIIFETVKPDTTVGGSLTAGDYFMRVRPENQYTNGEWQTMAVHIYGPPVIEAITPSATEVLRGQIVTITIVGEHLDYAAGGSVEVFGVGANVISSTPDQLTVRVTVPSSGYSDVVSVSNDLGSAASSELVYVATIGYIMDTERVPADFTNAALYKLAIDNYGGAIRNSRAHILPFNEIATFDTGVFDVVVIGWDTGDTTSVWTGGEASMIAAGGAHVLGMGWGGTVYFDALGLDIGSTNVAWGQQTQMYVTNGTADIYTQPNDLKVAAGERIDVYGSVVDMFAVNLGGPQIGLTVHSTRQQFELVYSFAEQQVPPLTNGTRNFLWSFHAPPLNMSSDGGLLLENVLVSLFNEAAQGIDPPLQ